MTAATKQTPLEKAKARLRFAQVAEVIDMLLLAGTGLWLWVADPVGQFTPPASCNPLMVCNREDFAAFLYGAFGLGVACTVVFHGIWRIKARRSVKRLQA